ncbi:Fur family transcriptional regulator [Erythrobacter sp. QSSC1-22B]|uniref:Fur family transcriptional regulator n=1 Tax=Erythrobacter sp. QSSC1-22B TaxID=1860125 RepID=UPI00082D606A|nr:transcriptional repressor [Erythrobacter sp. QSSC1-22B]
MTPLRKDVLHNLWKAGAPIGAYTPASSLRDDQGRGIAGPSVYRILKLFSAAGLVRRVDSKHSYCLIGLVTAQTDVLMMCDDCGRVAEISADKVRNLLSDCSGSVGFRPSSQPVEVAGRCLDCTQVYVRDK